jgi:hypothetical protein
MPGLTTKIVKATAAPLAPEPDRLDVSVVIPAHNEEHGAGSTVERVRAVL